MTMTIEDVEIFKAGTWNGHTYTPEQVKAIADNFNALYPDAILKPPLKLGHAKNQKLLQEDGYPSAGWITKVKAVGDVLVATFSDVPRRIAEIIKNKGYKTKSCEIVWNGTWAGKKWDRVLTAVSLLGGDIPAVESLADIEALYERGELQFFRDLDPEQYTDIVELERGDGTGTGGLPQGDGGAKFCVCPECGSSIEHTDKGKPCIETKCAECGAKMKGSDTAKLEKEENVEDKEKVVELEKEKKVLEDKLEKAGQATKDAEAKEKTAKEELSKVAEKAETEQIDTFVETLVKDGKVLPAEKDSVKENLHLRDDSKETKTYTIPDGESKGQEVKVTPRGLYMKELSARGNIAKLNEELSLQTQEKNTPEVKDGADEESAELDTKVQAYMKEHPDVSYEEAGHIVVDPKQYQPTR